MIILSLVQLPSVSEDSTTTNVTRSTADNRLSIKLILQLLPIFIVALIYTLKFILVLQRHQKFHDILRYNSLPLDKLVLLCFIIIFSEQCKSYRICNVDRNMKVKNCLFQFPTNY